MRMIFRKEDAESTEEAYEVTPEEFINIQNKVMKVMLEEGIGYELAVMVLEVTLAQMKKYFGIKKVRVDNIRFDD